ncbi:MAG: hypothetical protein GX038_01960 [Erysipelothrix sp.]|nr:hypothetical protein [Erysipelothrix sp.]
MVNIRIKSTNQIEVFSLQFEQFIIRNKIVSCDYNKIETQEFELIFEKNRLVKKPGYEILLQDIESSYFECSDPLVLKFIWEGESYEIKIKR